MSTLTNEFESADPAYKKHKLYVHCHLHDSIRSFYELDIAALNAAKDIIKSPPDPEDIKSSLKKFGDAKKYDENLLEWHRKRIECELKSNNYGDLETRLKTKLGL